MAFLNKVKSLFRGGPAEKKLPSYIQDNVNPKDHWNIVGELGDGAFGKVEKAVSKLDSRRYAASKSIEIQEGEELEDFLVEIEILTQCKDHPNMLGLYSCYFFENKLTMMLEFCGGGAVDNIMLELEKPLNEHHIKYIGYYICDALKWIHSQNVIHRDLKAGNILLTNDGQVRLADFGVSAKLKSEREKRDTFIGTPYWMAPEVMMCETFKDQPYDCKADIWSYGITLIEMAQIEPPHSEVSPMRVLIKVQKSPPPTLDEKCDASKAFRDVLQKCLIKSPHLRISADELLKHPWFNNAANERKHILALLAEVQADVREEVIIDEDEESVAESEELVPPRPGTTDSWSSASESPLPATVSTDNYKNLLSSSIIDTPPPEQSQKKRAAPPPPQASPKKSEQASYVEVSFMSNSTTSASAEFTNPLDNRMNTEHTQINPRDGLHLNTSTTESTSSISPSSSSTKEEKENSTMIVSPRREALEILDDLNVMLEDEQGAVSPSTSYLNATSPSPPPIEHTIRDVIMASREKKAPPSPIGIYRQDSPSKNPIMPSSSNESMQGSLHKSSSYQSVTKQIVQSEKERIVSKPIQPTSFLVNRHDEGDERASISSQSSLRNESDAVFKKPQQSAAASYIFNERSRPSAAAAASLSVSAPSTPAKSKERFMPVRTPSYTSTKSAATTHSLTSATSSSRNVGGSMEYFETSGSGSQQSKSTPPPEPPVDYVATKENKETTIPAVPKPIPGKTSGVLKSKSNTDNVVNPRPLGTRRDASRQTVTKKTRTYMIDGVQVTSTTVHVLGVKDDKVQRKQQLHDLRRLQRDEARQKQELQSEGIKLVEEQAKKFTIEQSNLNRTSELEMDAMERRQRKEIEEAEAAQETELRIAQKRLKIEQEKDMKAFRERLKQEMKIFKQELTMLSKTQRKDALKQRRDQIEIEHQLKEKDFLMQIQQNGESMLQRMADKHKERMASIEKQFLMQKHNLLRAKENNIWELEDKQMREKFVLHRKLFKDEYYLLRTQMLARHQREMSQIEKNHQEEEDELIRALTMDRKKLPKMLRSETKTRSIMFKESLRISMVNMSNAEMQERIRRFDEQEALRMRTALDEHDLKSQKKLQALKERHQEAIMELDEMQNEKRKQLLEKERNTMNEHEAKYHEMRDLWQENLTTRKTVLEEKFQEELSKQEIFYGIPYTPSQASTISGRHMP